MCFLVRFASLILLVSLIGCGGGTDADPVAASGENSDPFLAKAIVQIPAGVPPEVGSSIIDQQAAMIRSDAVLRPVAEKLELQKRWTMDTVDEAIAHLQEYLQIEDVRGTDLIHIRYLGNTREFAGSVVNGVALSLRSVAVDEASQVAAVELEALKAESLRLNESLEAARSEMLRLMDEIDPEELGPLLNLVGEVSPAGEDRLQAVAEAEGSEKLALAAELELESALFTERYPEYLQASKVAGELTKSGLGKSHPERLEAEKKASLLQSLLADEVDRSVEMMREKNPSPAESVTPGSRSDLAKRLIKSKLTYGTEKKQLQELKHKLAIVLVNQKLPRSVVTIHMLQD